MSENTNPKVRNIETVRDIEKRELNSTINSYVGNKHELMARVPELIDWNIFQKRCVPELVRVLQMQYKRLQKRGVGLRTEEKTLSRGWESGKEYYLQTESRYQDGPYSIGVLKKKVKRTKSYSRGNSLYVSLYDKVWFTYFMRQEPGEKMKVSSEDIGFTHLGAYGRESEYQLKQNDKQERANLWAWISIFWILIGLGDLFLYGFMTIVFPVLSQEMIGVSLVSVGCLDLILRGRLLLMYLRYRRRVKSRKVLRKIRQQYPEFCLEKFAAMTSNRIKAIFYADSMADIGDFVSCDLTEFLRKYANVVDCESMDFWFMGMSQDENYEYIDVRQKVLLTGDLGNRMKRKKLTVKIRYMRSKDSIMYTDFYRDWYISEIEV